MKTAFVGYYTPSEDEFQELWKKGRIIVDANVLLAAYGVSPSTCETLLSLFEAIKDRLWIPNQFALEYQRNRIGKILEQVKHYDDAHKSLKSVLDNQFRSRTQHPFVLKDAEDGLERICQGLLDGKVAQESLLASDPHFARTTNLFAGRVGAPYSDAEMTQAIEAGRKRFTEKIPPGFKDSLKPEPERYGDYIGWRQILDFAVKDGASVIFITDDAKEDWWNRVGSQSYGPRPELVAEFRRVAKGLFYMYSSDRFLEHSTKYFGGTPDPKAISELKERREAEPQFDAVKATAVHLPEQPPPKSTNYLADAGSSEGSPLPDAPKLPGDSIEKSGGTN